MEHLICEGFRTPTVTNVPTRTADGGGGVALGPSCFVGASYATFFALTIAMPRSQRVTALAAMQGSASYGREHGTVLQRAIAALGGKPAAPSALCDDGGMTIAGGQERGAGSDRRVTGGILRPNFRHNWSKQVIAGRNRSPRATLRK
jgi:hypothetical protein